MKPGNIEVAACGAQLSLALFLVEDAIVTATVTITMIAALTFQLLLTTNTVVSKINVETLLLKLYPPDALPATNCMWMHGESNQKD